METSYYNKLTTPYEQDRIISISVGDPKWLTITKKHKMLMPSYVLLKNFRDSKISEQQYIHEFMQMLQKNNPQKIYDELHAMHNNPILCCHCGTKHFCHRHLVATWFESNLSIKIPEYQLGNVSRHLGRIVPTQKISQSTLF